MPKSKRKSKPALGDLVLEQLQAASEPLTSTQIAANLGLRKDTRVRSQLRKLAEAGVVQRRGTQKNTSWKLSMIPSQSSSSPSHHSSAPG